MTTRATLGKSILLVEDDAALRALLATVLETAGFSVTAIRLAEDAPEVLRLNSPDLIVLDLGMPRGTMKGPSCSPCFARRRRGSTCPW